MVWYINSIPRTNLRRLYKPVALITFKKTYDKINIYLRTLDSLQVASHPIFSIAFPLPNYAIAHDNISLKDSTGIRHSVFIFLNFRRKSSVSMYRVISRVDIKLSPIANIPKLPLFLDLLEINHGLKT